MAESQTTIEPSEPPFEFLAVTHLFEVLDADSTTHRAVDTYRMRARRKCRFFEHRYKWSGSGAEKTPRMLSSHRLHGPLLHDGDVSIFLIDLGRDLAPEDEETVEFEQRFIDRAGAFKPFLRKSVRFKIGELRLRLRLPTELRQDVRSSARDILSDEPVGGVPPASWDPDREWYELHVSNPAKGVRYEIHWL